MGHRPTQGEKLCLGNGPLSKCQDCNKGPLYTVTVTVKEPYANVIGRIDIELPRDEALELLEQCGDAFKVAEDVDF